MSHTTKVSDELQLMRKIGRSLSWDLTVRDVDVIHNSDWSGPVEVVWTNEAGERHNIKIPEEAVRRFALAVAIPIMHRKLAELE